MQASLNYRDKILERVQYDSKVLINYLFSNKKEKGFNSITIYRVRVKRIFALSHYFARIKLNDYEFDFHPGSQPNTFQTPKREDEVFILRDYLCDKCTIKFLEEVVESENNFNIVTKNCETILRKRFSFQTTIVSFILIFVFINLFCFSNWNIFFILFLVIILLIDNNLVIIRPFIRFCDHYGMD